MTDFSNDPILQAVATTLELLGLEPRELRTEVVDDKVTVVFWQQARSNAFGRYDAHDLFALILPVTSHYREERVRVEYAIDYVLGRVSIRLTS